MSRVEALRRAWIRTAEYHAGQFESAIVAGNGELARRSAAAYRTACRRLRDLRLFDELGKVAA